MLAALALAAALARPSEAAGKADCPYTAGVATIPVAGHPFATAPSKDGCWVFASLSGEAGGRGGIAVLHNDGGRFSVKRTVDVPSGAKGLTLSHDGALLVAASGDFVRVFDVSKLQAGEPGEIGHIADGAGSETIGVALSADDHLVFASDERAARLTVADLESGRRDGFARNLIIGRIPQGVSPVGLALSPDGAWLYATSERAAPSRTFPTRCRAEQGSNGADHPEGALAVIDVHKAASDPGHALVAALPAGCNPVRVAVTNDGSIAWVTARGENAVYSIPVAEAAGSAKLLRTRYNVGKSPIGVIAQPGSDVIWITNSSRFSQADGDIQSISPSDVSAAHIPTGPFPRDLQFLPDGRTLVVAVFGSKAIQLVPTGP